MNPQLYLRSAFELRNLDVESSIIHIKSHILYEEFSKRKLYLPPEISLLMLLLQ